MKTLNKIIKGGPDGLVIDFANARLGWLLKPNEIEPFRAMLVSVFNAGKNGIVDPNLKADFEEFYTLYPKKVGLGAAKRSYVKARKIVDHKVIMDGLRAQLPEMMTQYNTDKSFFKHPSTWLRSECWADETADKPATNDQIMTDAEIFDTPWGQEALKQGSGYALRLFIAKHKRKPAKPEYQAILDEVQSPFKLAENKKLQHYLKG
jgi:hypothetical protein